MNVVQIIGALGGVASKWQMLERGATEWEIGRARHEGRIVRVRRAWYSLPTADRELVVATRVGGMLTCSSLLRSVGVWAPESDAVHVSVAANASRLRSASTRFVSRSEDATGVVLHWRRRPGATATAKDTAAGALAELPEYFGVEQVVPSVDSALHQRLTSPVELRAAGLHPRFIAKADSRAESGGETFVRLQLNRLRTAHRSQVPIADIGRVDFLIGDRLVLEVDGYAFHGDRTAFERDRERDLRLTALGYLVIRVSYRQVTEGWSRIERALLAILRSRRHRWPRAAA